MTTVYITLRDGQNRLIVDGSLQLFSRLLETLGTQNKLPSLPIGNYELKSDDSTPDARPVQEVQHAQAG